MEEERESVSRTLEYAYDDWCIAEMARMMGSTTDYNRYIQRAQYYKNVFDPVTNFMRPRSNAGWVKSFDPSEVSFGFTEANSWQYTFFVPQDISGLAGLMGGKETFAHKLDDLFTAKSKTTGREQADITGLIGQYAHGNEPSHHMAYLYDYVGQPWKTQYRVRQILDHFYKPEPDGLIGNEDCGQMSAWYVLSAAGFYPVTPGSTVYAVGSPLFPQVRFNLENGRSFVIKAKAVSPQNLYIQSAMLNGKPYRKSFITHNDLMAGGELVFEMGASASPTWGTGAGNSPISQISDRQIVPVPLIEAAGKTFKDRLKISFETIGKDLKVEYTTEGSESDRAAPSLIGRPFLIHGTTTVKARAIDSKGEQSLVATATYQKIPHNWSIQLNAKYSSQYTGGGDEALIDGIRGTSNFSGGAWQGYQGQDLVAVVDLGKIQNVSKLGAGFLQDVRSWIWMPRAIDFEISSDGKNFVQALSIANSIPDNTQDTVIKDFVGTIHPQKARYVRIRASNYGKIPAWHAGFGGDAWIFVDEILIQ
jgi:hypothetical protein